MKHPFHIARTGFESSVLDLWPTALPVRQRRRPKYTLKHYALRKQNPRNTATQQIQFKCLESHPYNTPRVIFGCVLRVPN